MAGSSTTLSRTESFQPATQSERDTTAIATTQGTGLLKARTQVRRMNGQFLTDDRTMQVLVGQVSAGHSTFSFHKEAKEATGTSESGRQELHQVAITV